MKDDNLVAVFNATDEVQALLYRSMLEEAGIDVVESLLEAQWLESVKLQGLHSQLLVRQADEARARELIAAFREEAERGELAVDNPEDLPGEA
ncbi:MAG: putative signal transducing protein [Armatimonadota bacterium]